LVLSALLIDLHTHSFFSDGSLIPSELVRRVGVAGYAAVAITDHADSSNLDHLVPRMLRVADDLNRVQPVKVIPGVELTHIPPELIHALVKKARDLGAKLVVIHGETIAEPVAPGTNRAGLDAGADIIAHPGLISVEEARLAAARGVFLEVSARKGHSLTNGHVARLARETNASMVLNSDGHASGDFLTETLAPKITQGAGLPPDAFSQLQSNARKLLDRLGYPLG
jgi:putative hydrolase